jgi:hypothetical protein
MSRNIRGRIRMLFAIPSAAVLVFGASQALASPVEPSRAPDCDSFCAENLDYCETNPTVYLCRYCGC